MTGKTEGLNSRMEGTMVVEVVEYMREEYAGRGVEIVSTGKNTIKATIPPLLEGISEIISDLVERYEVVIDIEMVSNTGMEITVWCPCVSVSDHVDDTKKGHNLIKGYGVWYGVMVVGIVWGVGVMRWEAMWHDIQGAVLYMS